MADAHMGFDILDYVKPQKTNVEGTKEGREMAVLFGDPKFDLSKMPVTNTRKRRARKPKAKPDGVNLLDGVQEEVAKNAFGIHATKRFDGAALPDDMPPPYLGS